MVADLQGLEYTRAGTVAEALDSLEHLGPGYRPIAGGTDLLVGLRKGWYDGIQGVIDISRIAEMRNLSANDGATRIGSCVTHAELANDDGVRRRYPVLGLASAHVGSPQIRNRGTIGGNVVGAAPCADTIPALVVAGALVEVIGRSGARSVPITDFITGPYSTTLQPQELVTAIGLPRLRPGWRWGYQRLSRRGALDRARASVAVIVWLDAAGEIEEVRVAVGAALPRPRRLLETERLLQGQAPSVSLFNDAAGAAASTIVKEAGGRWSAPYKEKALAALTRRALHQATGSEDSSGE